MVEPNVVTVTLAAALTAAATGIGALPFVFRPTMSRVWVGISGAVAGGFMISASLALVIEGADHGGPTVALGFVVGAVFLVIAHRWLAGRDDVVVGALSGADARKAILIVAVMTVHSFSEGVGVGVSFGGGEALGVFITLAIAVHNIPEGLAISLVLVPRGARVRTAAAWSVFSSLPQPLMAAPAFLFVEQFDSLLAPGLGFAAGAMSAMVVRELLPEARATAPLATVVVAFALSFVAMTGFQYAVLA